MELRHFPHWARSQAARLLFPRGSTRTVLRGPAKGTRFVVREGMGLSYALGRDAATPRHYLRMIRPGMVVFDVGANCGQSALLFSRLVGPEGRVVSFEPAPEPFAALEENVRVAGCANVGCHRLALSDACGEATFLYSSAESTAGKLRDVEPTKGLRTARSFAVPTSTIDALVSSGEAPTPDFLKVDVEGAGAVVLRGAARTLREHQPVVFIELHGPEETEGVREHLLARGYVAEDLEGQRVRGGSLPNPVLCYPEG